MREETRNESTTARGGSSGRSSERVSDVMTRNPATVSESDSIGKVAKLMVECDCGAIPVVEGNNPVGMITDRDIVVRIVAEGRDVSGATVRDAMTRGVHSVRESDSLDKVFRLMSEHQVRRVPVLDDKGSVCGIVALADVATQTRNRDRGDHESKLADAVEEISEKSGNNR